MPMTSWAFAAGAGYSATAAANIVPSAVAVRRVLMRCMEGALGVSAFGERCVGGVVARENRQGQALEAIRVWES